MHSKEFVAVGGGFSVRNTTTGVETEVINSSGEIKANIKETLAQGSIYIGGADGLTSELSVKTDKAILIGNGTTAAPQVLSGDATITNAGVISLKESLIQTASVSVSSAEILALYTTAKQLVAAPAAGKVLEFISATISYVKGGTTYTIGSSTNLSVKYKDKTGADVSSTRATTGFIDQASAQYSMIRPLTATLALDANAVAQPLCLALVGGNPTNGDGTLTVNIAYRTITL